jgi:ABC-type oligopeptide transport system ATPase subunit
MDTIRIDHVSKAFPASGAGGSLPALRQVSFGIGAGEVVTLIGESGSGKTTLGKIVLRLARATSGSVYYEGDDISLLRGARLHDYYRHVQGVFQDPFSSYNPIYKADRIFQLLREEYFPRTRQRVWDAKIESALHAVTLNPGDVLGKYPHQLSGGQQQRLLIARALLLDVALLVADEIISMLDASTRVDVLNLLVTLKQRGLAILFITHDLSLGNYISDRTVILRQGAIVEMGQTVKVFGDPRHSYTKTLLEAVPQLHRKWPERTAGARVPAANGSAALAHAAPRFPVRSHRPPYAARDQAFRAPQLTEIEPGHLVAAEEPPL